MKRIILTFGLVFIGLALFGQSPRIRLNQITKDSLTGSVVLSGSDSNMVYSRDFFLNLTDSVLILFGDTLSTTATAFTGVATDLTLTGDGSVATPLKVDTSVIATIKALADSVATRGTVTGITAGTFLSGGTITTSGTIALDTASAGLKTYISDNKGTVDLASGVTETLPVANGGTGATTLTANKVLVGNGTSAILQPTNLHWDNTNSRLGIGTSSPGSTLTIENSYTTNGALTVNTPNVIPAVFVSSNSSNGNFYFGNSNSSATFFGFGHLNVNNTLTSRFVFKNFDNDNHRSDIVFQTRGTGFSDNAFILKDNGNIGIGTSTPSAKLDVVGSTELNGALTQSGGDANFDSGTLFVDESANRVGIGTTSPSVKLQVDGQIIAGNVNSNDYDNATTNPGFNIGVVDPTGSSRAMNLVHYGGTTVSASALFRLRRSRGTSVGDYTKVENGDILGYFQWLYSNGTTWGVGGGFRMEMDGETGANDFPTRILFHTTTDGTASNTEKMRLNNAGELLIGYTSDQGNYRLQVQDSVYVGGNVSANAYTTRSDIRLKENITQYNNGLNDVLNLYPVYFYQKEFPTKQRLGFIAQDVRDIVPQAITDDEQNDYLGIEYSALIPVLTKAIQEQQVIIQNQEQEIETLKTQIQNILTEINNLKNN